jgi:hypothetical protein
MSIDFDRIQSVIRDTMRSIAQLNVTEFTEGNYDRVENDVDASFFALGYAFPEVDCLGDTVTRRCAKSEIFTTLEQVVAFRAANPGVAFYHLFDDITAESVMEDIMDMCEEDDEDGLDESILEALSRKVA